MKRRTSFTLSALTASVLSVVLIAPPASADAATNLVATDVAANVTQCSGQATTVKGGSPAERLASCGASQTARAFVAGLGLPAGREVVVEIHDVVTVEWGNHAFSVLGQFDPKLDLVQVTSWNGHTSLAHEQPTLGQGFSEGFHRSFVVHEITHALIDPMFPENGNHRLAHEYIAYVAQIATMDEAMRAQILGDFNVTPFDRLAQINTMLYAMSPDAYAVKSFKHFQQPENGIGFVEFLLDGGLNPVEWE